MKFTLSTVACCCLIPLFILANSTPDCELDQSPPLKIQDEMVVQPLIFYTAAPVRIVRPILHKAVAFSNRVYVNNSIPIRLKITAIKPVTYDSTDSYANLMYTTTLEHRRASIVIFVSQLMLSCGRTFLNCKNWSTCGYAVVKLRCLDDYSLLHELGHLHGANHNKEYVWPGSNAYPDAYGTVKRGVSKTIMAYGNEPRIPFFSNSEGEDNRRVIIENRFNFKR